MTRIIHHSDLPQGGFGGIDEKQMVMNPCVWPKALDRKDISHGFGDFIYLSLGHFIANDGAPTHPHNDVDIVSVVFNGNIRHKGSLGDGTEIHAPGVQVQRAGTGMQHAEYNLDNTPADFVQIWFMPPEPGLEPVYKNFALNDNQLTTVLGGKFGSFNNTMSCQVGFLQPGQTVTINQYFVLLMITGSGSANDIVVKPGDLIEGESLVFVASNMVGLTLILTNSSYTASA